MQKTEALPLNQNSAASKLVRRAMISLAFAVSWLWQIGHRVSALDGAFVGADWMYLGAVMRRCDW
jgi:hypothetical protein